MEMSLSKKQFDVPDTVPDGLARTDIDTRDRIFLLDRPYGGGGPQSQSVMQRWRDAGTSFEHVSGYAPTADDFADMGPAVKEGPVPKMPKKGGVLTEVRGEPHSVSDFDTHIALAWGGQFKQYPTSTDEG